MIESNNKRTKLVGEFIRKRRENLGMSQRSLGLLFSPAVTTQFISNVERGVTPLPPAHIPTLAKALDTVESEIMILLEKEYAHKLNGRLGRVDDSAGGSTPDVHSALSIDHPDYNFMKNLYNAYRLSDSNTRQAFMTVCESILKLSKTTIS